MELNSETEIKDVKIKKNRNKNIIRIKVKIGKRQYISILKK